MSPKQTNACKDMIYDEESTTDQWRIYILPKDDAGGHWKSIWKKIKWNSFLKNAKINSRETNVPKVKGKTIQLLVKTVRLFS